MMAEYAGKFLRYRNVAAGANLAEIAHAGGTCHDVGKLLIPTRKANEAEYLRHPIIGAELLEQYRDTMFENVAQAQMVIDIVRYHHEHSDGSGFPYGLKNADIPFMAGICAVADWMDYRFCIGKEAAISIFDEIKSMKLILFCENALECFEHAWPYLEEQYFKWNKISIK